MLEKFVNLPLRNGVGIVFYLLGQEDDWITRREPDPIDISE